jgi:hypothetical protein
MGFALSGALWLIDNSWAGADGAGATSDPQAPVPQESILSSLRQAFKQDFDHEVVRGHFDVGSPPDVHRYYCLVDPKTGKKEPNGVPGKPVSRPDGMTGIKATAVSTYSCASAEQQGILATNDYVLSGRLAGANAPAPAPVPPAAPPAPNQDTPNRDTSPVRVDVAGVKLGMSPDEVRAVLKSKRLLDYYESSDNLIRASSGTRFVNVIAAWSAAGDEGESFQIMFTPVPGKERAMAIVHSMGYSPGSVVREVDLKRGLVAKYGGFAAAADVSASPTWRVQSGGATQVGDSCDRRGVVGGLAGLSPVTGNRKNLALKTTLDEFQFQIDHCGVAIVTEDHVAAGADAQHAEPTIARFTVTAYSPSIGFEGAAAAAQLLGTSGGSPAGKGAHSQDSAALPL